MSYSRWSNSRWYTFAASKDDSGNYDYFDIMPAWGGELVLDFEEIDEDIDAALCKVHNKWPQYATFDLLMELRGYMEQYWKDAICIPFFDKYRAYLVPRPITEEEIAQTRANAMGTFSRMLEQLKAIGLVESKP